MSHPILGAYITGTLSMCAFPLLDSLTPSFTTQVSLYGAQLVRERHQRERYHRAAVNSWLYVLMGLGDCGTANTRDPS